MTSIERTAYPQLTEYLSFQELESLYGDQSKMGARQQLGSKYPALPHPQISSWDTIG
jgi:hypothetical protein